MMVDYVPLGSETEYFWYQSTEKWSLSSIPNPKDSDPIRYAIVACIVEELVRAFNWRLALGMRRNGEHIRRKNEGDPYPPYTHDVGPDWTSSVPPIKCLRRGGVRLIRSRLSRCHLDKGDHDTI